MEEAGRATEHGDLGAFRALCRFVNILEASNEPEFTEIHSNFKKSGKPDISPRLVFEEIVTMTRCSASNREKA
jgi:hypothetical protein